MIDELTPDVRVYVCINEITVAAYCIPVASVESRLLPSHAIILISNLSFKACTHISKLQIGVYLKLTILYSHLITTHSSPRCIRVFFQICIWFILSQLPTNAAAQASGSFWMLPATFITQSFFVFVLYFVVRRDSRINFDYFDFLEFLILFFLTIETINPMQFICVDNSDDLISEQTIALAINSRLWNKWLNKTAHHTIGIQIVFGCQRVVASPAQLGCVAAWVLCTSLIIELRNLCRGCARAFSRKHTFYWTHPVFFTTVPLCPTASCLL